MTEFAKGNPVKYTYWAETDDLTLLQAALLTFGIEPFSLEENWEYLGERVTLEVLREGKRVTLRLIVGVSDES